MLLWHALYRVPLWFCLRYVKQICAKSPKKRLELKTNPNPICRKTSEQNLSAICDTLLIILNSIFWFIVNTNACLEYTIFLSQSKVVFAKKIFEIFGIYRLLGWWFEIYNLGWVTNPHPLRSEGDHQVICPFRNAMMGDAFTVNPKHRIR